MKTNLFFMTFLLAFGFSASATKKIASTLGWNATDASVCFTKAINFDADTIIIDKQISDWNVGPNNFYDLANKTIIFESGVVLKAINSSFKDNTGACLVQLIRAENITIIAYGATFQMDRAFFKSIDNVEHSEWRHSLAIENCKNISIYGLKTYENGGDGIIVTGNTWYATPEKPNLYSENITIKDVWCDRGWRQGISVSSVKHLRMNNCWFTNTDGTYPMNGIDVEAETPQHILTDVVIENCRFTNNAQNGISLAFHRHDSTSAPVDVTFRNCYTSGNLGSSEIYAIDWLDATSKGNVKFERCLIENTSTAAVLIRKKATNYFVSFDDCAFVNVSKAGGTNNPIKVQVTDYAIPGIRYGGVAFNNCLLSYSPKIPFLKAAGSSSKSPGMGNVQLNNLTVINPDTTVTYNVSFVGGNVDSDCVFDYQNFATAPATSLTLLANNSALSDCDVTNSVLTATRSSENLNFPIPVTYAITGTASQESDFGRMVGSMVIPKDASSFSDTIFTLKDNEVEPTESVDIALKASTLFTSGSSNQVLSIYDCAGFGADTIVTFEDRPKPETALTGTYSNINWGVSGWATYSEATYSPHTNVLKLNSNSETPQTDTLIILSGKALRSMKIAALGDPTVKEVVISSAGNPDLKITDMTSAFTAYHTNWTVLSDTIFIKITCDSGASSIIFDDLTFGDILAPAIPSGLILSEITSTSATLSWDTAADNMGIDRYEVFNNGVFESSTNSTWLNITGLSCNTTYSLTVKAVDIAGNRSEASNPLPLTTAECDVIPPSVPFGLNSSNITPSSFKLAWSGSTDNDAVARYDVFKDGVKYGSANSFMGQNMVLNPGFEDGFAKWGNWSDNSLWAKDTTANFYSGAKSMRMLSPSSGGAGFGQDLPIKNFSAGDVLIGSCHARWDAGMYEGDVWGGCVLGIQVVYGTVKENYEVLISGVTGDSLYTVSTLPLKTGFNKIYIFGYRWLQLPGKTVYYDDFSLIKKTNEINVTGLAPSTSYSMTVKAVDVSGNISEASEALLVKTSDCLLPTGWKSSEIGATGQSSCESNGIFTIIGDGSDIWGTSDHFIYTYKSIDGDGVITAKVESLQNTDPWAKSGVMIREDLTEGSKFIDCILTPANGLGVQSRPEANKDCQVFGTTALITAPYWVRLERIADTFTAYQSTDGTLWTKVGVSPTIAMSNTVYFGLAVTSHVTNVSCTSIMSNVSIQGVITGSPEITSSGVYSDISVYPNPASDNITISNIPENAEISIFTMIGNVERKIKSVNKSLLNIDVSNWNKGVYLVKVSTENKVFVKKVIVE